MGAYPALRFTNSGTITTQNLVPAGTATANSAVEIDTQGLGALAIQVTGTYTGALTLQATLNGTAWITIAGSPLINVNTGGHLATVTSALQTILQAEVSSFIKVRLTALAAVTGTATVMLVVSSAPGQVSLDTGSAVIGAVTQSGTWTSALASNSVITPIPLATQGFSTFHKAIAAASTNATSVKTSAGTIGMLHVTNLTAAVKYFKLYNKASAPTVGTDVPVLTHAIPPNVDVPIDIPSYGLRLATGIAYAITGAYPDADTTAIAANDVVVNMVYV